MRFAALLNVVNMGGTTTYQDGLLLVLENEGMMTAFFLANENPPLDAFDELKTRRA